MKPGIPSFLCSCNNFSLASKVTKTGFSMKTLNRRPHYRCQGAWLAPRINQLHSILWYWTQPGRRSQTNTSKGQGISALAVPPLTPPLQSENNTFLPPRALREAYTHTFMPPPAWAHAPGACAYLHAALWSLSPWGSYSWTSGSPWPRWALCTFKRLRLSGFFFPEMKLQQYR